MSMTFRNALSLLILSLGFITPALAQSQSIATPPAASEVNNLAVALVRVKSETEQQQLLDRKDELKSAELLMALKALADPLVQKGDLNEAIRISHLAVRVAEKAGDRMQLGLAFYELAPFKRGASLPKKRSTTWKRASRFLKNLVRRRSKRARCMRWALPTKMSDDVNSQ